MRLRCKCLLLILLLASFSPGFKGQESEKNDVSRLLAAVKLLEQSPFDKRAKDARKSALMWVIETDKVSVIICPILVRNLDDKYKYGSEMLAQYTIGMAAFKLTNAGKDEDSAQLAGIESALTSYEAMVKEKPAAKNSFMDELVAKRSGGTLAEYLAGECKVKK